MSPGCFMMWDSFLSLSLSLSFSLSFSFSVNFFLPQASFGNEGGSPCTRLASELARVGDPHNLHHVVAQLVTCRGAGVGPARPRMRPARINQLKRRGVGHGPRLRRRRAGPGATTTAFTESPGAINTESPP